MPHNPRVPRLASSAPAAPGYLSGSPLSSSLKRGITPGEGAIREARAFALWSATELWSAAPLCSGQLLPLLASSLWEASHLERQLMPGVAVGPPCWRHARLNGPHV